MVKLTVEIEQLIARYLNGDCSKLDEEMLMDWIAENPEHEKLYLEIKDTWDASLKVNHEQEQLLHFYKSLAAKKRKTYMTRWTAIASIAAVLLVGLVLGGMLYSGLFPFQNQVESFTVPMGSRSELTLSDGTKVNLNSDSRLELSPDFSSNNRVVKLYGEGYFEVKSDKKHPFTVQTSKFDVKVTGTKFNISSYADDQKISATLAEGRIELSTINHNKIKLKPGQKIIFDQQSMEPQLEEADVASDMAWVKGEFVFKNIPFSDLIKRLERWYDVKLIYKSSEFSTLVYSGNFKNQETIWQVLDALQLTTPIRYKKINFREFELIYKPM